MSDCHAIIEELRRERDELQVMKEPRFIRLHAVRYIYPKKEHPELVPLADDATQEERDARSLEIHMRRMDYEDRTKQPEIVRMPLLVQVSDVVEARPSRCCHSGIETDDCYILTASGSELERLVDETFEEVAAMLTMP